MAARPGKDRHGDSAAQSRKIESLIGSHHYCSDLSSHHFLCDSVTLWLDPLPRGIARCVLVARISEMSPARQWTPSMRPHQLTMDHESWTRETVESRSTRRPPG